MLGRRSGDPLTGVRSATSRSTSGGHRKRLTPACFQGIGRPHAFRARAGYQGRRRVRRPAERGPVPLAPGRDGGEAHERPVGDREVAGGRPGQLPHGLRVLCRAAQQLGEKHIAPRPVLWMRPRSPFVGLSLHMPTPLERSPLVPVRLVWRHLVQAPAASAGQAQKTNIVASKCGRDLSSVRPPRSLAVPLVAYGAGPTQSPLKHGHPFPEGLGVAVPRSSSTVADMPRTRPLGPNGDTRRSVGSIGPRRNSEGTPASAALRAGSAQRRQTPALTLPRPETRLGVVPRRATVAEELDLHASAGQLGPETVASGGESCRSLCPISAKFGQTWPYVGQLTTDWGRSWFMPPQIWSNWADSARIRPEHARFGRPNFA